jgi:hypothetical protein
MNLHGVLKSVRVRGTGVTPLWLPSRGETCECVSARMSPLERGKGSVTPCTHATHTMQKRTCCKKNLNPYSKGAFTPLWLPSRGETCECVSARMSPLERGKGSVTPCTHATHTLCRKEHVVKKFLTLIPKELLHPLGSVTPCTHATHPLCR